METIRLARNGDVLVATIDHPDSPVNAVDGRLHHELGELFRTLQTEREARAIVLAGAGRAFSAGGDMTWFPSLPASCRPCPAAGGQADHLGPARRRDADRRGVNGAAAGLGASIALLCDLIVMADTAVIVDPHVNVGLVAGDGGVAIWPLRSARWPPSGTCCSGNR